MTRLERFKKLFPYARCFKSGYPMSLACDYDKSLKECCKNTMCNYCRKDFWDEEVDDNGNPIKATEKMPNFVEEKEINKNNALYLPIALWFSNTNEIILRYTVEFEFLEQNDTLRTESCKLYYYGIEDYYITQTANGSFHIFHAVREE